MSEAQLRAMIDLVSEAAERRFKECGYVAPVWYAITADGEQLAMTPPTPDKDFNAVLIRAAFEAADVVRYVFIDEAWTLSKPIGDLDLEKVEREGLSKHPDRVEVVLITGEDIDAGQIMGHRAIIRPKGGKPHLGPLVMDNYTRSEGRMVGLLPAHGARN
jgi:hypothetical protein